MLPWQEIARTQAPDGSTLELRRRGAEYLIRAGGHDLMSTEDEGSSRALAELGCAHMDHKERARVLVGGLGMGFTLRAALDVTGPQTIVEVSELVPAVADWNRGPLGNFAKRPLDDARATLCLGDVRKRIQAKSEHYAAILLDVDNGPLALAHATNDGLYSMHGLAAAWQALTPGGVLGVWSLLDDQRFTRRLQRQGFAVQVHRVPGSRKGRGRFHVIWVARKSKRSSRK